MLCTLACAQVILVTDIPSIGKEGEIKNVLVGFWRNYLLPNGMAKIASESILGWVANHRAARARGPARRSHAAQGTGPGAACCTL